MISTKLVPVRRAVTGADLLAEASAIGDQLVRTAIFDGARCNWLSRTIHYPASVKPSSKPTAEPLDHSVHNGVAGVALFLLRLHEATGEPRYRAVAEAALRTAAPLAFQDSNARHGYYAGALGPAWAAHEAARVFDEPAFARDRDAILNTLWRGRSEARGQDIMFGAASAIPVLLRMHEDGAPNVARTLALWHADDLLRNATVDRGAWSWGLKKPAGKHSRHLTGFSHGQSGIGWGLAHAYAATERDELREAALGAFAYERRAFDRRQGDWRDLRNEMTPDRPIRRQFSHVWCYGSPGIGLARIDAAPLLGDAKLRRELAVAARNVQKSNETIVFAPGGDTCLCHGVAGNADCLWLMQEALGEPGAAATARATAEWLLQRYGARAGVPWPTGAHGGVWPAMMTGTAGVGLFLLRVQDQGATPTNVLPPAPRQGG